MSDGAKQIWLIRHGQTEWSESGQHTGRTDIPLTPKGKLEAAAVGRELAGRTFALVLSSPRQRALETCRVAGYGASVHIDENLQEWDYGDYEGCRTADIRKQVPGWLIFDQGVPNGETIDQVAARARQVIDRALRAPGDAALFAHGHILRILTACWLKLPPVGGRLFALDSGSMSVLGYEHNQSVIRSWNRVTPV